MRTWIKSFLLFIYFFFLSGTAKVLSNDVIAAIAVSGFVFFLCGAFFFYLEEDSNGHEPDVWAELLGFIHWILGLKVNKDIKEGLMWN